MQTMLGMSAREALYATTVNSADLLGLPRGRIAAGDVADLLALERDIETDLRALRNPTLVVKSGAIAFQRS